MSSASTGAIPFCALLARISSGVLNCNLRQDSRMSSDINASLPPPNKLTGACSQKTEEKKLISGEERMKFAAVFPTLVEDIVNLAELSDMPDTNRWTARVMHYNVPYGKLNRYV